MTTTALSYQFPASRWQIQTDAGCQEPQTYLLATEKPFWSSLEVRVGTDWQQPCHTFEWSQFVYALGVSMQGAPAKQCWDSQKKSLNTAQFLLQRNTSSSNKTLCWPITHLHVYFPGRLLCYVNAEFLLFTTPCDKFAELLTKSTLFDPLICYSNWTFWIVFHCLTGTLNNTPPSTTPLRCYKTGLL